MVVMTQIEFELKKDKFRSARGGYARFLNIFCKNCDHLILLYQKDGPGPLKRMYCDRIIAPHSLSHSYSNKPLSNLPKLSCPKCKSCLATPYNYEKENRAALLVHENAITKKLTKGFFPKMLEV